MSISTAEFLAKLNGMNWVEEKYEREKAIGDGAPKLWMELCLNLKECVGSYAKRYGGESSNVLDSVQCDAASGTVTIRKTVKPSDPRHAPFAGESTINVALQWDKYPRIVATTKTAKKPGQAGTLDPPPVAVSTEFPLDADQGGVFMKDANGKVEIDHVSRRILEKFLFG